MCDQSVHIEKTGALIILQCILIFYGWSSPERGKSSFSFLIVSIFVRSSVETSFAFKGYEFPYNAQAVIGFAT